MGVMKMPWMQILHFLGICSCYILNIIVFFWFWENWIDNNVKKNYLRISLYIIELIIPASIVVAGIFLLALTVAGIVIYMLILLATMLLNIVWFGRRQWIKLTRGNICFMVCLHLSPYSSFLFGSYKWFLKTFRHQFRQ